LGKLLTETPDALALSLITLPTTLYAKNRNTLFFKNKPTITLNGNKMTDSHF
jgi:hypothetical protein